MKWGDTKTWFWKNWAVSLAIGFVALTLVIGWLSEPKPTSASPIPKQEASYGDTESTERPGVVCEGECQIFLGDSAAREQGAATARSSNSEQYASQAQMVRDDLLAQRRMAHWQTIVSVLTGVGVAFVVLTLRTAFDANKGFAHAAKQQLTAYVVAEAFEVEVVHLDHGQKLLNWSFVLRNAGQTPAFNVAHNWTCEWGSEEDAMGWRFELPSNGSVLGPGRGQRFSGRVIDPNSTNNVWHSAIEIAVLGGLGQTIWMKGAATYQDVSGCSWRHDYQWKMAAPNSSICLLQPIPERHTVHLIPHVSGNDLRMIEDAKTKPNHRPDHAQPSS